MALASGFVPASSSGSAILPGIALVLTALGVLGTYPTFFQLLAPD